MIFSPFKSVILTQIKKMIKIDSYITLVITFVQPMIFG